MIPHQPKHAHESGAGKSSPSKLDLSGLHRDWRTWVVIGLMLAAMGIYVLSLDESIQPQVAGPGNVPAAAAPASPPK